MSAAFAYPIASTFREIPVGKWAFVGRKRAGEMTWHYTMPSVERDQMRTACASGEVITTQFTLAGAAEERDFGLLARRVWR